MKLLLLAILVYLAIATENTNPQPSLSPQSTSSITTQNVNFNALSQNADVVTEEPLMLSSNTGSATKLYSMPYYTSYNPATDRVQLNQYGSYVSTSPLLGSIYQDMYRPPTIGYSLYNPWASYYRRAEREEANSYPMSPMLRDVLYGSSRRTVMPIDLMQKKEQMAKKRPTELLKDILEGRNIQIGQAKEEKKSEGTDYVFQTKKVTTTPIIPQDRTVSTANSPQISTDSTITTSGSSTMLRTQSISVPQPYSIRTETKVAKALPRPLSIPPILFNNSPQKNEDANCQLFVGGTCYNCRNGYLRREDGLCVQYKFRLCKTINKYGRCTECLPGSILLFGLCR